MSVHQRILLVKTSSMGDVIHNLPVATDLQRGFPGCEIHWVVEEAFAAIPRLHPAVREVIPVALRRWRRGLFAGATWREMSALRRRLQAAGYHRVIDTQGLAKSALIAALARGERCGYDRSSAREPLAALLYHRNIAVSRELHAVERNRLLAAGCAGCEPDGEADYGIEAAPRAWPWLGSGPYMVLLHASSRDNKLWSEPRWIALGHALARRPVRLVLPWGNRRERERSQRLAHYMPGALVPPALGLEELAALMAGAQAVVGVDTGLTHLAAALQRPVVGIYCATDPGLTGVYGGRRGVNLGGAGAPPGVEAVLAALERVGADA